MDFQCSIVETSRPKRLHVGVETLSKAVNAWLQASEAAIPLRVFFFLLRPIVISVLRVAWGSLGLLSCLLRVAWDLLASDVGH